MLYLSYLFSEKFPLLGFEPQTAAVWVHEADDIQIVVTLLPVLKGIFVNISVKVKSINFKGLDS